MPYCYQCGTQTADSDKFCQQCGYRLGGRQAADPPTPVSPEVATPTPVSFVADSPTPVRTKSPFWSGKPGSFWNRLYERSSPAVRVFMALLVICGVLYLVLVLVALFGFLFFFDFFHDILAGQIPSFM